MASKLSLYNGALRELGERRIATLADAVEARRLIDDVYDSSVRYCLEQGQWNFAIRAIEANADTGVEPTFGFDFAFEKPDDIIRILGVSGDPDFDLPLGDYLEEGQYWYSNVEPIYVRYVSDDTEYGLNLSTWPATFTLAVETWIASLIAERLTSSRANKNDLLVLVRQRFVDARSKDAQRESSKPWKQGRLTRARAGSSAHNRFRH